jgi:nucleotide-binding universal stress UspA family protein
MEKKILVAVDDSIHTRQAMHYAVRISSQVTDLWFTLFYVQPTISQYLLKEADTDLKAKAELKKVIRNNDESAHRILGKLKNDMVRMGISEARIDLHTKPKTLGLAKDIMDRAQQGLYDAIVVGRRGLSRVQKAFMGSVTANLIEHATFVPLWVVDGNVKSSKIMIAVDGSESSLRAVDHLSFMVGENPQIRVTMFHVRPTVGDCCVIDFEEKRASAEYLVTRGDRRCVDHFYAHASKILKKANVDERRVEIRTTKRPVLHVGRAIVNEAKKGDYGTVVIGRTGISQAFFMGSVSRYVIDKTSDRALWVVR